MLRLLRQFASILATMRAAIAVAASAENHRMPAASDLRRLGINEADYRATHI